MKGTLIRIRLRIRLLWILGLDSWLRLIIFLDLGNLIKRTCHSAPKISQRTILNPSISGFNVTDRSYAFLAAYRTLRRQEQGKFYLYSFAVKGVHGDYFFFSMHCLFGVVQWMAGINSLTINFSTFDQLE